MHPQLLWCSVPGMSLLAAVQSPLQVWLAQLATQPALLPSLLPAPSTISINSNIFSAKVREEPQLLCPLSLFPADISSQAAYLCDGEPMTSLCSTVHPATSSCLTCDHGSLSLQQAAGRAALAAAVCSYSQRRSCERSSAGVKAERCCPGTQHTSSPINTSQMAQWPQCPHH